MGIKCQLSTRSVPSGLAAMCTLRAMTPPKTVHINVQEKAFYLHQTDNGLNFELYFCSGFFFVVILQQLEEQIDHFAVLVCVLVFCALSVLS